MYEGYVYPILTNSSNYKVGLNHCDYHVTEKYSLGLLLEKLGFDEYININKVKKILYVFTNIFLANNCRLFGVVPYTSSDKAYLRSTSYFTKPSYTDRYSVCCYLGKDAVYGWYKFEEPGNLPLEYFDVLQYHNQPTRFDVFLEVSNRIFDCFFGPGLLIERILDSFDEPLERLPFKPKGPERRHMIKKNIR